MQFFGWHWKTLTSAELSKRLMKMVMASSLPVALCVAITVALFLVDTSTSDYVEAPETSIVYCIAMALWVVVLLMTLLVLFYGLPEAYAGIFWEMLTTTTASRSSRSSSSSSSSSSSEQVKDNRLKQFKTAKQPPPFDEPMLVVDKDAAYTVLPKELGRDLVKRTKMKVTKAIDKSPFLKQHSKILRSPLMAKYCLDKNIQRQDLVGSGGFASVYHCVVLNCSNAGKRTWRTNQYVIKHMANKVLIPQEEPIGLPKKLPKEEEQPTSMLMTENKHQVRQQSAWHTNPKYRKLYLASKGLLLEAHLLATLNHPHIIKLHGISKGVFDNIAATGRTDGFFLVLPKLVCTLQDKIEEWRNDIGTLPDNPCDKSALYQNLFSRKKRRKQFMEESFKERLHMIMDVLKALEYLHDHRIIHRDVKPANIGLDESGCLKLFDFGLAKILPPLEDETEEGSNSQYNSNQRASTIASLLGGNKGTSRYIAPEILNRLPYGCKVDVYSTTITLWQCLALERPYNDVQHATAKEIKESVAIFGDLPEIARHWPKGIRQVIELGWSRRSSVRPSSTEMRILLEQVIEHPHRKPHL